MVSKKEHLSSAFVLPLLLRWPGAQNFPHCNSSPHNIIYSCDAVRGWCWRQSHFPRHLPLHWIRIFKMLVLVNHSVSVQKDFSASPECFLCPSQNKTHLYVVTEPNSHKSRGKNGGCLLPWLLSFRPLRVLRSFLNI